MLFHHIIFLKIGKSFWPGSTGSIYNQNEFEDKESEGRDGEIEWTPKRKNSIANTKMNCQFGWI